MCFPLLIYFHSIIIYINNTICLAFVRIKLFSPRLFNLASYIFSLDKNERKSFVRFIKARINRKQQAKFFFEILNYTYYNKCLV